MTFQWHCGSGYNRAITCKILGVYVLASNTFEQQTRFHIVTMVMLKYVKREARPSYKPSNLSQQNIEAAQKLDVDAINQQQTNCLSGIGG